MREISGGTILPFASFFHRQVSKPAALSMIAGSVMLLAIAAWGWSELEQARLHGDTPEVCRVILEQNPFMIKNFGHLREERFQAGESCAFQDQQHHGCTEGVYTYAVYGSQAEGVIKAAWIREPGANGSLYIISLQVLGRRPVGSLPPPAVTPVERPCTPASRSAPEGPASEA
jgi:hypothetical protein